MAWNADAPGGDHTHTHTFIRVYHSKHNRWYEPDLTSVCPGLFHWACNCMVSLYLWSESCLQNWQVQTAQGRRWRGAGPEPPRRARGHPDPRWTARALLSPSWSLASDSDEPERKRERVYIVYIFIFCCSQMFLRLETHNITYWNHSSWEQLFAPFTKQRTGSTVTDRTTWDGGSVGSADWYWQRTTQHEVSEFLTLNAEEVLPCVHGQTGLVAGWCQGCDITRRDKRNTDQIKYDQDIKSWVRWFCFCVCVYI